MTHSPTVKFFEKNAFFGYPEEDVCFFSQGEMPCVSFDGKLLMSSKHKVWDIGNVLLDNNKNIALELSSISCFAMMSLSHPRFRSKRRLQAPNCATFDGKYNYDNVKVDNMWLSWYRR